MATSPWGCSLGEEVRGSRTSTARSGGVTGRRWSTAAAKCPGQGRRHPRSALTVATLGCHPEGHHGEGRAGKRKPRTYRSRCGDGASRVGPARLERATSCSGGKRSIQLSYGPVYREGKTRPGARFPQPLTGPFPEAQRAAYWALIRPVAPEHCAVPCEREPPVSALPRRLVAAVLLGRPRPVTVIHRWLLAPELSLPLPELSPGLGVPGDPRLRLPPDSPYPEDDA